MKKVALFLVLILLIPFSCKKEEIIEEDEKEIIENITIEKGKQIIATVKIPEGVDDFSIIDQTGRDLQPNENGEFIAEDKTP